MQPLQWHAISYTLLKMESLASHRRTMCVISWNCFSSVQKIE